MIRLTATILIGSIVLCGFSAANLVVAARSSASCLGDTQVNPSTGGVTCNVMILCDSTGEVCDVQTTPPTADPFYSHCKCLRYGEYLHTSNPTSLTVCHRYTKITAGRIDAPCTVGPCDGHCNPAGDNRCHCPP
jgi:hypothetical protein